jgi:hypothetical protein
MFNWFKNKTEEIEKDNVIKFENNYKTLENDDIGIEIKAENKYFWTEYSENIKIEKSSIISHMKNSIVYKDYRYYHNFGDLICGAYFVDKRKSIENKENIVKYKETQLKTYEYFDKDKCWRLKNENVVGTEIEYEKTPLEVFKEEYKSKYKLIETEEEFNEYMSSTLDCDTWCRKKLYDKMKELGLGDGFINQFADLVGNNLDKYHAMIDLANEVTDKDTLMYLYTYKFGKK